MHGQLQNWYAIPGSRKRIDSLLIAFKQLLPSCKAARNLQLLRIAGILVAVAAATTVTSSQAPHKQSFSNKIIKGDGKKLFEAQCAVCHGMDGGGGEHAPNLDRASSVKSRSDSELFHIIRDGILGKGMPSFSTIGDENIRAVLAHLRSLQGKTATRAARGDPVHGQELFEGKGGCADCHRMSGYGRFVATDLTDFAASHDTNEIRDAILNSRRADGRGQTAAVVTTIAGDRVSGLIRNENNSSLQIQDAEGRFYLFVKASLRSIDRSTGPAMPASYQRELSKKEIEDLVSYIAHQTFPPKVASGQLAGSPDAQIE